MSYDLDMYIYTSHSQSEHDKRAYNEPCGYVWNEGFRYAKANIIDYLYDAVTNALIIIKFFFDGLVLPCSQFQILSSKTPTMLATSDCMSLLSIRFSRICSPIVLGLTG